MGYSSLPTFPSYPGLALPVIRTPMWYSFTQESVGGVELIQVPWSYPRYRYELPFDFLRQGSSIAEVQSLMAFINQASGRSNVFQFQDVNDYLTTGQPLGVANSSTASFQMLRARGGYVEPVFAISTITSVTVAGATVSTSAFTISNMGVITFSTIALGNAVSWAGTYNWFCRFDADQYAFEQITASSGGAFAGPLWGARKISFHTVKFGA